MFEKLTCILAVVPAGGAKSATFDKMLHLARQSGARVEFFLVAPSDYFAIAGRVPAANAAAVEYTLHDGATPVAAEVLRRVAQARPDLVVVPRALLDLDACPVPVLMLADSPWAEEPRFAAAVDVANADCEALTRGILHVAGFLAQRFTAHLDILYCEREHDDQRLRMERAVRLARMVREYHVGCERLQVFDGTPERVLVRLIADRRYDVVVVGTAPHRGPLAALHSVARKLAAATAGDVLLVGTEDPSAARSAVQQLAHQA
jgi:TusA-related sulfurtransferase